MLVFDDLNLNQPLKIYNKKINDVNEKNHYTDLFLTFQWVIYTVLTLSQRTINGSSVRF